MFSTDDPSLPNPEVPSYSIIGTCEIETSEVGEIPDSKAFAMRRSTEMV